MSEHDDKLMLLEYCQKNWGKMNIISKKVKAELGSQLSHFTLTKLVEEGLFTINRNDRNEYILSDNGRSFIENYYTNVITEKELSRKLILSSISSNESTKRYSDSGIITNRLVVVLGALTLLISVGSLSISYLALVKESPPPIQLSLPQQTERHPPRNIRPGMTRQETQPADSSQSGK